MKAYQKLKLSGKIGLAIIILLIIGFGFVGTISYISAANALTKSIETNLSNSAQDGAKLIATKIEAVKQEAKMIALRTDIRTMDWTLQKTSLTEIVETMGYMRIGVADTKGAASFTNGTTSDLAEREYIKQALAGTTSITNPMLSKLDGKMVVVVATPIKDLRDRVVGVLIVTHDSAVITNMSNDISVGTTGYSYIIDKAGVTVAHPDADKVTNAFNAFVDVESDASFKSLVEVEQKMVNGESGYGEYSFEGVKKVIAYAPIPDSVWSIALAAPKAEFFSDITNYLFIIAGTTGFFILMSIIAVLWIIKVIVVKPITKLVEVSDRLATGDINLHIEINSSDEIGTLSTSFQTMIDSIKAQVIGVERISEGDLTVEIPVRSELDIMGVKLNELIEKNNEALSNISTATEQVALGASQVSDFSVNLAQGATEQASSMEELSVSINEIAEKTYKNAQDANEANALSERTKTNAAEGKRQMQDMLAAMEDINTSSGSISKIIKVIDDIAFQTNILALNAAVEAARAGQHGKGFAVVAEEVRNLAARSANAAKETTDLIESSIKKVEGGTKIANQTADSLNKIVDDVDKTATLVSDIAVASNVQSDGIKQINQALTQVSAVVQSNSATSEESAAASEELSSQAVLLKNQVVRFSLRNPENWANQNVAVSQPLYTGQKGYNSSDNIALSAKASITLSDNDLGKY